MPPTKLRWKYLFTDLVYIEHRWRMLEYAVVGYCIEGPSNLVSWKKQLINGKKMDTNCPSWFRLRLHGAWMSPFLYRSKMVECSRMVLFTHNIKKIKGAAHKNGDVGSMCERGPRRSCFRAHALRVDIRHSIFRTCHWVQRKFSRTVEPSLYDRTGMLTDLLPSATKLRQGNVFTPVCDSVTGGCLPKCMLGYTPLAGSRPWADTPLQTPPGQTPLPRQTPSQQMATAADGRHPTGMHSCLT